MAKISMVLKQKDIDLFSRKLRDFGLKKKSEVRDLTAETALGIQSDAKKDAPVDLGAYRSSIKVDFTGDGLGAQIGSEIGYGPYLEFGTGKMVNVPAELEAYAAQFKGKGIREVNLPARPHLFPAFERWRKIYMDRLEKIFKGAP